MSSGKYIIEQGDTLWKIAQTHGTTVDAIVELNKIQNPDLIFPGQGLILPSVNKRPEIDQNTSCNMSLLINHLHKC